MGKTIKCKVKLNFKIHPKGEMVDGGNAILSMYVTEVLEGKPKTDKNGMIKIIGRCKVINYGEENLLIAEEEENGQHGLQYKIGYIGQEINIDNIKEPKKYLSAVLTETQVTNLFNALSNPLKVIVEGDIDELCKAKGVGKKSVHNIINRVLASLDKAQIYVDLDGYGLTKNMIDKLLKIYNSPDAIINIIQKDPYKLIKEVDGIGFKRADEIALTGGMEPNSPHRLKYLAEYILEENAENGYSWLDAYDFMDKVYEQVDELDEEEFFKIINDNSNLFYAFDHWDTGERCISLRRVYELEDKIKDELARLQVGENELVCDNLNEQIIALQKKIGYTFTDEQLAGIKGVIDNQVTVITGFGGTGKSSTLGNAIKCLGEITVAQTALSGRAASRMAEISGEEGFTIHRLLGFSPDEGFLHNRDYPLEVDMVVVDEVSMIGGEIFYSLLQAIPTGAKLVLLGDTGQLESIGKLNILNDLIASGTISCHHLTKPHRQALESGIIEASMKFRNKEQIFDADYDGFFTMGELEDCHFDISQNKETVPGMIADYFKELIADYDIKDVQVIVPGNVKGSLSCESLNPIMQDIYNHLNKDNGVEVGDYELRIGDKVINRKNNYKCLSLSGITTPIFNGEVGIVKSVDKSGRSVVIDFATKGEIEVIGTDLYNIKLGYVISTHSSQGSQFDHVIYGVDYGAYTLLNKEQVYTAITRAKKCCITCAENKAFRKAVSSSEINKKQTFLQYLLKNNQIN